MLRIPEGIRVTISTDESAFLSCPRMDGGVLLASSGPATDINVEVLRVLFDQVEKALSRPHQPARIPARHGTISDLFEAAPPEVFVIDNVLAWTLQEGILDGWGDDPLRVQELLHRFHGFASTRSGSNQFLQTILVRRSYFDEMCWLFQLIKGLGIEVRETVPDGTALAEVHRPHGAIVSVLVGTTIESVAGSEPQRFARERDLAMLRGDGAALQRIDEEERRMIESAIRSSRPPERPRPFELAPRLRALIEQTAAGDAGAREKILRYLLERTTPLLIPTKTGSSGRMEGGFDRVGTETVIKAFPDLRSTAALAAADRRGAAAPMRPADLLELCRCSGAALLLESPGENGLVSVIVRPSEVDALARNLSRGCDSLRSAAIQ